MRTICTKSAKILMGESADGLNVVTSLTKSTSQVPCPSSRGHLKLPLRSGLWGDSNDLTTFVVISIKSMEGLPARAEIDAHRCRSHALSRELESSIRR